MVVLQSVWLHCKRTQQMLHSGEYHHLWITHWKFESFSIWDCSLNHSTSGENHETTSTIHDDEDTAGKFMKVFMSAVRTEVHSSWYLTYTVTRRLNSLFSVIIQNPKLLHLLPVAVYLPFTILFYFLSLKTLFIDFLHSNWPNVKVLVNDSSM